MTHEEMATWLETWGEAALNISEGERLREIAAEFRRLTAPDDLGVDPFDIREGDVLIHHPTGERREILCAAWLSDLTYRGEIAQPVMIVTYRTALEGGGTVNLSEVARSDQWLDWCNEAYLEGGL